MAVYEIGGAEYEIADDVQGEQLNNVLSQIASQHAASQPATEAPAATPAPEAAAGKLIADANQGDVIGMGRAALQGGTFGWADEAGAIASAAITNPILRVMGLPTEDKSIGDLYSENLDQFKTERNAYAAQNPIKAAGAEIVGGVATGLVTGGSGSMAGLSNIQKAAQLAKVGATQGAVYGAGSADEGSRIAGAAKGLVIGAIAAPVIGGILQGSKTAINYASAKLAQTPRDQAIKALRAAAEAEGMSGDDAVKLLDDLGPEATLADLGENFRALARVAANKVGSVKASAGNFLNSRQSGQAGRLLSAAEQATGANADDFRATVNMITARRSVDAKPLYDAAFSRDFKPSEKLLSILDRPSIKSAMSQAEKIAADEGQWAGTMNLPKQIHYAKVALDRKIESLFSSGSRQEGRALVALKNDLLGELDSAIPEYKQARAIYAGDSSLLNAADKGKKLFSADFDELSDIVKSMSSSEKELFKLGAMRAVQDKLDAVPASNDSVKRLLGQPRMVKLLGLAFDNADGAKRFVDRAIAENAFTRTRNVVTGNSTTAAQLEGAQSLSDTIQPESILSLMRGDVVGAGLNALRGVIGKKEPSPEMLQELGNLLLTQGMQRSAARSAIGTQAAAGNQILFGRAPYNVGAPVSNALLNQVNSR